MKSTRRANERRSRTVFIFNELVQLRSAEKFDLIRLIAGYDAGFVSFGSLEDFFTTEAQRHRGTEESFFWNCSGQA